MLFRFFAYTYTKIIGLVSQREQQEPEVQMLFCLENVLQWFKREIFGGQTEMRRVPGLHLSRSEALGGH